MRDDVQPIHGGDARALAVGQAQAAADGLLDQRARVGGAQRDDGVEVRDVPALLEHVDVDDDLGRLVGAAPREQPLDHLVLLRAGLARIDLDDPVLVPAFEERVGLDQSHAVAPACVVSRAITSTNGFTIALAVLPGVGVQLHLHVSRAGGCRLRA